MKIKQLFYLGIEIYQKAHCNSVYGGKVLVEEVTYYGMKMNHIYIF